MTKILYILNVAKRVNNFSYTSMKAAQELGYEFHIAGNWGYFDYKEREADEKKLGIKIHQIDFIRTPYNPRNIRAYKQIVQLIKREHFDIIHCNTPIGGFVGRLAGKKCGVKHVIYQAHGFHFFRGAPILNWILYYPIERFLAHFTDVLITINQEDYERAQSFNLRNDGRVYYVHGVGIETQMVVEDDKKKRDELGFNDKDILCISAGDLVDRKNYMTAIEAISKTKRNDIHYLICGIGPEEKKLKQKVSDLGMNNQIHFLGFRSDVKELMKVSDIFLLTSFQEGLPRSLLEAMSIGLPVVVSKIRGNVDLIEEGKGGFLCYANDSEAYANALCKLSNDLRLRELMSETNRNNINKYSITVVINELINIYKEYSCFS